MVLFCLVTFFAVVVGVNAVMIGAAVTTFSGVETRNAYQAGVAFAREEAAAEAQESRHWRVNSSLRREANGLAQVELSAQDRGGQPLAGLAVMASASLKLPIHGGDRRSGQLLQRHHIEVRFDVQPPPGASFCSARAPTGRKD